MPDPRPAVFEWVFNPTPPAWLPIAGASSRFPVSRVWCVGRNYEAHASEMGAGKAGGGEPDPPFFFLKPSTAVVPGGGCVPYPPETSLLHHEAELVVAIAVGGRNIASTRALDHVYGYGVGVDLTRRDAQAEAKRTGRPWSLAKGFDGSAPCSAIAPSRDIGHPVRGRITAMVNGEVRQDGDLADQIWSVDRVIAQLSRIVEIRPGDLLFTGTPAGVGALEPGDRLNVSIEGVGTLEVSISAAG